MDRHIAGARSERPVNLGPRLLAERQVTAISHYCNDLRPWFRILELCRRAHTLPDRATAGKKVARERFINDGDARLHQPVGLAKVAPGAKWDAHHAKVVR